jgi:hypothetical protein
MAEELGMALVDVLRKAGVEQAGFLREGVRVLAQELMELEVAGRGAGWPPEVALTPTTTRVVDAAASPAVSGTKRVVAVRSWPRKRAPSAVAWSICRRVGRVAARPQPSRCGP